MKLYAICLVKNEDDIIGQTLTYATQYCDRVFVIDNGSTDRTWELVQSIAARNPHVVAFAQTMEPFNNALRGLVYNAHHQELSDIDWWLILDGDEFLAEDPRPVIEGAMKAGADLIRVWFAQYYYTDKDYEAWLAGRDDRQIPLFERRRYYLINWQETRFFRNQSARAWDMRLGEYVPRGLRQVHHRRLVIRHYQYRTPEQIEKRLKLRYGNQADFGHVTSPDWRSVIRSSKDLDYQREGEPWQFKFAGVSYYYAKSLKHAVIGKYRGVQRKLVRLLGLAP